MSDVLKIPFHVISGTYTTRDGYFTVANNFIKTTSKIFVQLIRGNGEWQKYMAYPRIDTDGYVSIFLRDWNGVPPNNDSIFNANIIVL